MPSDLPFIVALCPTFNHPELLRNSVALWERQDYPAHRRRLLILDDGGAFDPQNAGLWSNHVPGWAWCETWKLFAEAARYPSLPAKYNRLAELGAIAGADAFLVWEDDDIYLPGYVSAHARVLAQYELSKPDLVLSDYPGHLVEEPAGGRFHSTLGFRRELFLRIGGWPSTKRADFDQQMIAELEGAAESRGDPWPAGVAPHQYVYRWHTGAAHGQHFMRAPDDEDWYDRAGAERPAYVGKLEPKLDERTKAILAELGHAV